MNEDDKVKTGCMGILIPLACAGFGLYRILHPHEYNRGIGHAYEGAAVVGLGLNALGIAVFVHALGFVPYERIPWLKRLVAAVGVDLFICGFV